MINTKNQICNELLRSRASRYQTAYNVIPVEIEQPSEIRIGRESREQTDWIPDRGRE